MCVCVQLKELFPRFRLSLPPKRWFKDNYDMEFLEERQIGLQTFLQNLIAHKDIINRYLHGVCVCVFERERVRVCVHVCVGRQTGAAH